MDADLNIRFPTDEEMEMNDPFKMEKKLIRNIIYDMAIYTLFDLITLAFKSIMIESKNIYMIMLSLFVDKVTSMLYSNICCIDGKIRDDTETLSNIILNVYDGSSLEKHDHTMFMLNSFVHNLILIITNISHIKYVKYQLYVVLFVSVWRYIFPYEWNGYRGKFSYRELIVNSKFRSDRLNMLVKKELDERADETYDSLISPTYYLSMDRYSDDALHEYKRIIIDVLNVYVLSGLSIQTQTRSRMLIQSVINAVHHIQTQTIQSICSGELGAKLFNAFKSYFGRNGEIISSHSIDMDKIIIENMKCEYALGCDFSIFIEIGSHEIDIKPGNITRIQGKNGSGKSTLFKALTCKSTMNRPNFKIHGSRSFRKIGSDDDIRPNELIIYHIDQDNTMFPGDMTIAQVLEISDERDSSKEHFNDLCSKFNVTNIKDDMRLGQLSGGQCRKINLALLFSVAKSGSLVMLDEPTTFLDVDSIKVLSDELKILSERAGIMIITHDESLNLPYTKCITVSSQMIEK